MIWDAGFLILAMVQPIIDAGTRAVLSSRMARSLSAVLSQTSRIDSAPGYWSRRMSTRGPHAGGRFCHEELKSKDHVRMWQCVQRISDVANGGRKS